MADEVNDVEVELQCGSCGRTTKKSLSWIEENDEATCECGTMIPVIAGKYRKELARAESGSDGFRGLLEKLGK